MKTYILPPLILLALFVGARLCCYTVDAAEYAYVTVLGEHRETYDGADQQHGAGLKFGWPWPIRQTQRFDRRLQQFDLPEFEQLTHDPKGNTIDKILLIEAYVCWKIADRDAVDRFVKRIGSADRARAILEKRINGQLGAAIGQMRMEDLVNDEKIDPISRRTRVDEAVDDLRKNLLDALREPIRDEYGIELVDLRLRRFNHPPSVRDSIFERIRSERNKKVGDHESDGKLKASNIASKADEQVRKMLSEARAEEERIKTSADTEAMKIRNQAYSQDPQFYAFLKQMEKMQSILGDGKAVLLLSTHRQMFESLFQPPGMKAPGTLDPDKKGAK